jgi:hypothetical protein
MAFYNLNRVYKEHNRNETVWYTDIECTLPEKEGFERVFDIENSKWIYQSIETKDWNKYLFDIGLLKLSEYEKFDSDWNIVQKTQDELLSENIITKQEYNRQKIAEIDYKLYQLDIKSVRPLREGNIKKIQELELEAEKLRIERKKFI